MLKVHNKNLLIKLIIMLVFVASFQSGFAQQMVPSEPIDNLLINQNQLATFQSSDQSIKPFGANLFQGSFFVAEREDGINPEYIIQAGDRIALQIWGAININEIVVVDTQGNIFIPEVGPIQVAGIPNAQLNNRIRGAVQQVYTQNVNIYTNLQGTTPVVVFVTGFVNRPGSYAGVASDSILYYLERAGGIDLLRGSYREVRILRNDKIIESIDLYDFLLNGLLPKPQLTDGDTIVVGRKGANVIAEGAIRNSFSFEITAGGIKGAELIQYARPLANATYATVLGTRDNQPVSYYVPISELKNMTISDGDQVIFEIDQTHDTILVDIQGAHNGQSRFAIPRNSHLLDILNRIQVDPNLGDINSVSMRRESIRIRQKQAIQDSLNRLETAILGRTSVTQEGAQIQVAEAQLISDFVDKARDIEPQGILVVAKNGTISNPLLQPYDIIYVPQRTNVVQVSGEVMVPQAIVYEPDSTLEDYIERVGGYTTHADEGKHMILRRNGEVIPVYGRSSRKFMIQPGDEIISLPAVPSTSLDIIRMVTDTIFKIASSAAIFVRF
jgi:protein involved in polysaccharide export with SLBB domain